MTSIDSHTTEAYRSDMVPLTPRDIWPVAMRTTCKVCGRPDKLDFQVTDEEWARIVPLVYQPVVVCLACFDLFATARAQPYTVTAMWFAGDQGVYEFTPRRIR